MKRLGAQLVAALLAIAAFGGAWVVVEDFAPWAKSADMERLRLDLVEVAGLSTRTAIYQKQDILIRAREAAAKARAAGDAELLRTLNAQIERLELEIRRLEQKQESGQ